MIPGVVAGGAAAGGGAPPGGYVLDTENILRTATRTATDQGPISWSGFNAGQVTDGVTTFQAAAYSLDNSSLSNNGRGFAFTFSRAVRLGRFSVYRYNYAFNWIIQYWDGGSWVTLDSVNNTTGANPRHLDFNSDGAITASQWRLYVADWVDPSDNLYVYEVEGYELVPA